MTTSRRRRTTLDTQKVTNGNNFAFRLKGGVCFETYEAFDGSDFAIVNMKGCKTMSDLISR